MTVIELKPDAARKHLDLVYDELKSGARQHILIISELAAPDDQDGEITVEGVSIPVCRYAIGLMTEALQQLAAPGKIEFTPDFK